MGRGSNPEHREHKEFIGRFPVVPRIRVQCVFSMLFLMFPVFLVVEYMEIRRHYVHHDRGRQSRTPRTLDSSDWEHTGNKSGNTGNIFMSANLSIPPVEPVPLTLPVPQPALRPQTTGGTNLVGLCPLRLRLVNALLQDLGNCRALPAL